MPLPSLCMPVGVVPLCSRDGQVCVFRRSRSLGFHVPSPGPVDKRHGAVSAARARRCRPPVTGVCSVSAGFCVCSSCAVSVIGSCRPSRRGNCAGAKETARDAAAILGGVSGQEGPSGGQCEGESRAAEARGGSEADWHSVPRQQGHARGRREKPAEGSRAQAAWGIRGPDKCGFNSVGSGSQGGF